ncbi:hypothetical protein [Acuticoccus sediminis]|uniref:hypothetical protein n=1 Tax=Acuticoccus sediminis TaxID=2184697 RepID=UPI001CFF4A9E|nr:hypothetical protein [Acuticoccus sediminis]
MSAIGTTSRSAQTFKQPNPANQGFPEKQTKPFPELTAHGNLIDFILRPEPHHHFRHKLLVKWTFLHIFLAGKFGASTFLRLNMGRFGPNGAGLCGPAPKRGGFKAAKRPPNTLCGLVPIFSITGLER